MTCSAAWTIHRSGASNSRVFRSPSSHLCRRINVTLFVRPRDQRTLSPSILSLLHWLFVGKNKWAWWALLLQKTLEQTINAAKCALARKIQVTSCQPLWGARVKDHIKYTSQNQNTRRYCTNVLAPFFTPRIFFARLLRSFICLREDSTRSSRPFWIPRSGEEYTRCMCVDY